MDSMNGTQIVAGHRYDNISVADQVSALFGDFHIAGGLTINPKTGPHTNYTGFYAHNALTPVPTFVDRPHLRAQLEKLLYQRIALTNSQPQIVIVHGIGGAGKTQLVLDYIQRRKQDYSAVFWVDAGSSETLERDFVQIYLLLHNIHDTLGQDAALAQQAVPAVKRWFYRRKERWLFIFDNADSIREQADACYVDLNRFLLEDPCVHTIITTRDRLATELTELPPVEVDKMTMQEAVKLFQTQAKIQDITPQQEQQISAIVQELGHLALAITLAGSYVSSTPRLRNDLTRYLSEYRERRRQLLARRPVRLVHQYGESVLTTWEATFHVIEGQNLEACKFLALLSFWNQDGIPVDYPTDLPIDESPTWLSVMSPGKRVSQYDIEEYFRILASFSFVKYQEDHDSYSTHNLIQAWAFDRLEHNEQKHYAYVALLLLNAMTQAAEDLSPVIRGRLVPHVISGFNKVARCYIATSADDERLLNPLEHLASFLNACGHPKDEVTILRFLVQKAELCHGTDHDETFGHRRSLANALCNAGELQESLNLGRPVLDYCRQTYGEDHRETIQCMSNLAVILSDLGQTKDALSMYRDSLARCQNVLGADHPDTLTIMSNMGVTLQENGETKEALSVLRTVFDKRPSVLGENHLDTIHSMHNLAQLLEEVGQEQEALSMQQKAVEILREMRGENHPDTLTAMNNLAGTLGYTGNLEEALSMSEQVLERRQKVLGENHPLTLTSAHNLAMSLRDVGRLEEALSMQKKTIVKAVEILGIDHPDTALIQSDLNILDKNFEALQRSGG